MVRFSQRLFDELTLQCSHGVFHNTALSLRFPYILPRGEIAKGDYRVPGDDGSPFYDIFQFPHIAGIVVFQKHVQGLAADAIELFIVFTGKDIDEVLHQQRDVFLSFTKRGIRMTTTFKR